MMPRFGSPLRFCGVVLLVLAVSPVTAPFSTCSLDALLDGAASHEGTVLQPKGASNDPTVILGGVLVVASARQWTSRSTARATGSLHSGALFPLPLRI